MGERYAELLTRVSGHVELGYGLKIPQPRGGARDLDTPDVQNSIRIRRA